MTAFNRATHELITCTGVRLKPNGSADVQPCSSLDDNAADKLQNIEARKRREIIIESVSEWRRIGPELLRQNPGMTWRAWTNAALTQAGLDKLTPAEVKEYDN